MSCIKCNDALIKGLDKCPECGSILEKAIVKGLEDISENKLEKEIRCDRQKKNKTYEIIDNEKKIRENIELKNEEEMCEHYNRYIKEMKLYCLIGGLIVITFFIFILYIIF